MRPRIAGFGVAALVAIAACVLPQTDNTPTGTPGGSSGALVSQRGAGGDRIGGVRRHQQRRPIAPPQRALEAARHLDGKQHFGQISQTGDLSDQNSEMLPGIEIALFDFTVDQMEVL